MNDNTGELFALRWKDLTDVDRRFLTVREAVCEGMCGTPKTEAGRRTIPLSKTAWLLLDLGLGEPAFALDHARRLAPQVGLEPTTLR